MITNKMDITHVGNNIKRLRLEKHLTQNKLARKLGVSYQAVSKWENNICAPDIALLPAIANLFEVSIDSLFSKTEDDYELPHYH